MQKENFANITEFLAHTEFCPACKSRMKFSLWVEPALAELKIDFSDNFLSTISNESINLASNNGSISVVIYLKDESIESYNVLKNYQLKIQGRCKRLHYWVTAIIKTNKEFSQVTDVVLEKESFNKRIGESYYKIDSFYGTRTTTIYIQSDGSGNRYLTVPLTHFSYSNRKKIARKVKKMEILS